MKPYIPLYLFAFILALMAFLGQMQFPSSSWGVLFFPACICAFGAAIMGVAIHENNK